MIPLLNLAGEEARFYFAAASYYINPARSKNQKKLLVNGVPKSGTTWLYRMLLTVPGYQERGNFKGDISSYATVEPGQVIHGHDWYNSELKESFLVNNIKVVLVIRDLRDQTVSRMFHLKRDETHAWQPRIKALNNEEALLLSIEGCEKSQDLPPLPGVIAWKNFTRQWLAGDLNIICVRYEDLLTNPLEEMQKIFDALEMIISPSLLRSIIMRNRFERMTIGRKFWQTARKPGQSDAASHFRKGIIGDWKNHFTPAHRQRFKELAGDWLIEMGYETGLDW